MSLPGASRHDPVASADDGQSAQPALREVLRPAAPVALVVDLPEANQVRTTLTRLGCGYVTATAATARQVAEDLDVLDVVLLSPTVMEQEDGIHLVRDLRAHGPNVDMLLVAAGSQVTSPLLVQGMRAGVHDVADPSNAIDLHTSIDRVIRSARTRADRVLAIGAHPDDVEIGCSGTLLEHRRHGDRVTILTLSRGAVGGAIDDRLRESSATARSMGAGLIQGNLPDTRIDPGVDTIRAIESVVADLDPTIIYVHSRNDNHQDHRAVNIATLSASRGVPRVFAYQSPSATNDFTPTKFVAIDSVVARKVHVLGLFESQRERSYLEPEMIVASARYWARALGPRARYAEPFEVVRTLTPWGSSDPAEVNPPGGIAPVLSIPSPMRGGQ